METGKAIDILLAEKEKQMSWCDTTEAIDKAVALMRGYSVPRVGQLMSMAFALNLIDEVIGAEEASPSFEEIAIVVRDNYEEHYDTIVSLRGDEAKTKYWTRALAKSFGDMAERRKYFEDRWHNGGGFMNKICETLVVADLGNIAKLHKGFPELTDAYCCWSGGRHYADFMEYHDCDLNGVKKC